MTKKLLLIVLVFASLNMFAQSIGLSNFRIENTEKDRVYFDSSEPITGSTTNGFIISNKTISSVSINANAITGHYFSVSTPFTFWDNNTIRYEGNGSFSWTSENQSDIKNTNGDTLKDFTLSYILNNIPEPDANTDRYVTTAATGGGNGLTEGTAWTISEGLRKATSGMTVWIKAGNYGNQNLSTSVDGTATAPIKFVGYKSTIGDISSNYLSDYNSIKNNWNTSEMPTLVGNGGGEGISVLGSNYVFFRNIQFSRYSNGIRASNTINTNVIFDRVNGKSFTYAFINFESYQPGTNFHIWSNSNFKVTDCVALNSNLANFFFAGDGRSLFKDIKSYSDAKSGADDILDYHIVINGDNSIIINCHSENVGNLSAGYAHGIGIKGANRGLIGTSDYNLIVDCTAVSVVEGFYVRSNNCNHNVIKNSTYTNPDPGNVEGSWKTGGVWLWGGVNYNIVENVSVTNATYGLAFFDNQEENNYRGHEIGHDNIIRNSVFNKNKWAIYIGAGSASAPLHNNDILNCTFNDSQYFLKKNGADVKNLNFVNCIFTNQATNSSQLTESGVALTGFNFTYSNFYNNKGNWFPSGEGNMNVDPKYTNIAAGDFRLEPDSPIIDKGKNIPEVSFDFDGLFRPQGGEHDIGAFEKKNESTSAVNADAGPDVSVCNDSSNTTTTTLTASGGSSFLWSTGETTASIDVSPTITTIYTVTVFEGGESDSDEVEVTVNELPSVILSDDVTICSGETTTLTATGTGDFLWSTGETGTTITVSPTGTTTYSVVASSTDCSATTTDEVIVTINGSISLETDSDVSICSGSSAILTATSNGDFLWSTGETTASITVNPSSTTTYSVSSTNGSCSKTMEVIVTVNEPPTVSLTNDVTICSGEMTTLTATGTGDFLWNTGETTASIEVSPTSTTTYSVVASSAGCSTTVSDEVIVSVAGAISLDAGSDVSICSGSSVTLTATGNESFLWNTGETTASIEVSPSTTTTFSVSSTNGDCSKTDEVVVTVNELSTVDLGVDVTICSGETTTLTATGTGDFLWNTGETTASIEVSPNSTTTYSVVASSSNGCSTTASDEVIVSVTEVISVDAGSDVSICIGENVTLTASTNGNVLWSTGETASSITVSPSSTTTYVVTSSLGDCFETDEVQVVVDQIPTVNAGSDVSVCSGETVMLTATGIGNFLWSTGETTASIAVNPSSTTTYTVTASNSCTDDATDEITVTVNPEVTLEVGSDVSICTGENVTLTATSNGSSVLWSTGETTSSITVSPSSATIYSVTSSLGDCSKTTEVQVIVEQAPTVSAGSDVSICSGETITLTAAGIGNILWSTGETTRNITVTPSSTTTYSVTASSSCANDATDEITVTVNPEVTLDAGLDVSICSGDSVTLTATTNGNVVWSTGETTASITVNPSTTTAYSVTSTLGNCSKIAELIVNVAEPAMINAGSDVSICLGDSITLTATGGDNFLWSTGETTASISVSPLNTTTYTVTTSTTGICASTATDTVTVNINEAPVATANDDLVILSGSSVDLTVSGVGSFEWSTGEVGSRISVNPTVTTTYTVTATTEAGCSIDDEVVVTVVDEFVPSVITITAGQDVTICLGDTVILEAPSGTRYIWSSGETESSIRISPSETIVYSVKVFNGNDSETHHSTITVRENCSENVTALTANDSFDLDKDMVVYPNPTRGVLNVKLKGYNYDSKISVYNLNGTMLYSRLIDNNSRASVLREQLDLSKFGRGIYFISLSNNGDTKTKKVIVN